MVFVGMQARPQPKAGKPAQAVRLAERMQVIDWQLLAARE